MKDNEIIPFGICKVSLNFQVKDLTTAVRVSVRHK